MMRSINKQTDNRQQTYIYKVSRTIVLESESHIGGRQTHHASKGGLLDALCSAGYDSNMFAGRLQEPSSLPGPQGWRQGQQEENR